MAEEIVNIAKNEETEEVKVDETKLTEEQQKENEDAYDEALERLNSYGLNWTFRSIRYVIDKENIGFAQLRSCVYMLNGRGVFDFIKSVTVLLKAGLVGSKQFKETDTDALEDRAYEIIEDWRNNIGSISSLHIMIINQMETKHFFMGSTDMKILQHLSYKNLQKDLVTQIVGEDLNEKMSQAEAIAKSF